MYLGRLSGLAHCGCRRVLACQMMMHVSARASSSCISPAPCQWSRAASSAFTASVHVNRRPGLVPPFCGVLTVRRLQFGAPAPALTGVRFISQSASQSAADNSVAAAPNTSSSVTDTASSVTDKASSVTDTASSVTDTASSVTDNASSVTDALDISDAGAKLIELNSLGEPTLSSLGLGGYSPSGLMQQFFETIHSSVGLPWWASIFAGTVILRVLLFPLIVKAQRHAVQMHNCMGGIQKIREKMDQAKRLGNDMEASIQSQRMMMYMREKKINPMTGFLTPLIQAPIFMSVFFGLRGLVNYPLSSLTTGGLFWFTDLTVADPYYILPVVTCVTMLITIELGTDGIGSNTTSRYTRYFLRAIPICVFPFTMNFGAAILCYWVSTNFMALTQTFFLRIPAVRCYFSIPARVAAPAPVANKSGKSLVQTFKDDWADMKAKNKLEQRRKYDTMRFQRAGVGPLVKTFKQDPTGKFPNTTASPH